MTVHTPSLRAPAPTRTAVEELRRAARPLLPLPTIDGDTYASAHAAFEERSTQRLQLTRWLVDTVAPRSAGDEPLAILSVGAGDGTVDSVIADALTARNSARPVHYVGLDPHPASGSAFLERLTGLGRPGLAVSTITASFDELSTTDRFDVIIFAHSLYYVPDVAAALALARQLLAPKGEILVLQAPQAGLNELAAALAPPSSVGHPQWWAETTQRAIAGSGLTADESFIVGTLDLQICLDEDDPLGRSILDFCVQTRLPDALRPATVAVLRSLALEPDGLLVEHPLRAWRLSE